MRLAALDEYLTSHHLQPIFVMEMDSTEAIKQAVMAGMGLAFISSHTIGLEAEAGKLAVLDVAGLPVVRDWYVIHLQDKHLSPIAGAFRSFLLERGRRIIHKTIGDSPRTRV